MRHGKFGDVHPLAIAGVEKYSWDPYKDMRGSWQRIWDTDKFQDRPSDLRAEQISVSKNPMTATLRGMHYLDEKASEWKSVVCIQGLVQDVIVDMRVDSLSYRKYQSFYLDGKSHEGLLIPPGCAHGFITLEPDTILIYIMSVAFDPNAERALRWNDPSIGIVWDIEPQIISEKDKRHKLL
jgi:dTDP-4-dehydrorhamnose 3,5-epimerase